MLPQAGRARLDQLHRRADGGEAKAGEVQDALAAEIMSVESPEGAPPMAPDRRRSSVALVVAITIIVMGTLILMVVGGVATFGMGLVLAAILILAAFPVWVAALLRRGERKRADTESSWVITDWMREKHG
jgi:Na+-transporting methylmalonyl-CoA/oxaloacetate decarboxylase gamma subunit